MKENYELNLLLSGRLAEEEIAAFSRELSQEISQREGLILEAHPAKRIELAYPIRKERGAWLQTIHFSLDKDKLAEIEKKVKSLKEALRFLLLKKVVFRARPLLRIRRPLEPPEAKTEAKVELKEIEEKLAEILK
jgi:ribosomal protein S6